MNEINAISNTLVATVGHLLPKGSNKVFVVVVRMTFDDYSQEAEVPSVAGFLTLACYAPNSYMRVFAAVTPRPPATETALDMQLVCSHDSAWRDDGIKSSLSGVYRALKARAEAQFNFPKTGVHPYLGIENMFFSTVDKAFAGKLMEAIPLSRLDPVGQVRDRIPARVAA